MSERPTDVQLVASFRALLTEGFHVEGELACSDLMNAEQERQEVLRVTKPWRAELWKAFNEIEERLCPLEVETRRRQKDLVAQAELQAGSSAHPNQRFG